MKRGLLIILLALTACTTVRTPIENVQLHSIDGEVVQLHDQIHGTKSLVVFWASWCSFCHQELPQLNALQANVIGVNLQEDLDTVRTYWLEEGLSFPTYLDPHKEAVDAFSVFTQPTIIILDEEGSIEERFDGPMSLEDLERLKSMFAEDKLTGQGETPTLVQAEHADVDIYTSEPTPLLLSWYPDMVKHSIPLDHILSGGPPKDGIPSIDTPQFIEKGLVDYLQPTDAGVYIESGEEKKFYPFSILNWHEIVNDTIADTEVVITYCPLCASAVVYERDASVHYGVSGLLRDSNLLFYDRESHSLWDQVTGEAIVGPDTGSVLQRFPSSIVRFGTLDNNVSVLSTDTGYYRDYDKDPYEGYDQSRALYFPVKQSDDRLHPKEVVYGVVFEGSHKAYPASVFSEDDTIIDTIGTTTIEIVGSPPVFLHREGESVKEIPSTHIYWFSWVSKYPETELYSSN